jgi:hypothetical protein
VEELKGKANNNNEDGSSIPKMYPDAGTAVKLGTPAILTDTQPNGKNCCTKTSIVNTGLGDAVRSLFTLSHLKVR